MAVGLATGWLKMPDMNLADQVFRHEIDRHENGGHEIKGQDIIISCENKLHYNAVCNLFETTAKHKSQQQSKLYNMHMYNMLKRIKYYENINLKLATSEQWQTKVC